MNYKILVPIILLVFTGFSCAPQTEPVYEYRADEDEPVEETTTMAEAPKIDDVTTSSTGLGIRDDVVGDGTEAKAGDTVSVHYTGTFTDGEKFDSSLDRGTPFQFSLGAGMVIQGWDEGVAGMKIGGKRLLVVPPELGYGNNPVGPIPAGSTLVFEVELLDITS